LHDQRQHRRLRRRTIQLRQFGYLSSASLINCTVSGNFAAHGGGLYDSGQSAVSRPQGTITLTNTIVAAQGVGADILVQDGSVTGNDNLIGDGSGISGGTGNLLGTPSRPVDPLLAPLGDYGGPTQTEALLPGSPAIGGGASGPGVPATDQRGVARPQETPPDIGAFQSRGFTLAVVPGTTPQATRIDEAFPNPLTVTVMANDSIEPVGGGVVSFTVTPVGGASATLSATAATIAGVWAWRA
jgi:hypothetical protein